MSALLHAAPLTSLRDFATPPQQQQPYRICRKHLHTRPIAAHAVPAVRRCVCKQAKRDVKAHARVVAENPTAPEVKAGSKVSCVCYADFCSKIVLLGLQIWQHER